MFSRPHLLLVAPTLLLVLAAGCGSCVFYSARTDADQTRTPAAQRDSGQSRNPATTKAGAPRELLDDEAAGGHTLARHVGKSDDELAERLQHERIAAASTYNDHASAEQAVGAAIAANQHRIQDWLSRGEGHPNLVLDYDSPQPVGRSLRRGQAHSTPCSHTLVVLKWKGPADYYVLTSYPDCR